MKCAQVIKVKYLNVWNTSSQSPPCALHLYLLLEREADQVEPAAGHVLLSHYRRTRHHPRSGTSKQTGMSNISHMFCLYSRSASFITIAVSACIKKQKKDSHVTLWLSVKFLWPCKSLREERATHASKNRRPLKYRLQSAHDHGLNQWQVRACSKDAAGI